MLVTPIHLFNYMAVQRLKILVTLKISNYRFADVIHNAKSFYEPVRTPERKEISQLLAAYCNGFPLALQIKCMKTLPYQREHRKETTPAGHQTYDDHKEWRSSCIERGNCGHSVWVQNVTTW